jgi:deoxyribonuclease IV
MPRPLPILKPSPAVAVPLVGAHVSIAGGHHRALEVGAELGCELVQIFTKNNMQWSGPPLQPADLDAWRRALDATGLPAFAHSGYLINLASDDPTNLQKSRDSLLDELHRCSLLGLPFIVLHPGSHRGRGVDAGIEGVIASLDWLFARYSGEAKIALEFTAGQGDTLGRSVDEIAKIFEGSAHRDRLAVCLDTCHLFAAGYDVRTGAGLEDFIAAFEARLPWGAVVCCHVNDSKGGLGSRKDRHELLGQGEIGWELFDLLLRHPKFRHLPLCLETPKGDDNCHDRETLALLKQKRTAV